MDTVYGAGDDLEIQAGRNGHCVLPAEMELRLETNAILESARRVKRNALTLRAP